MLFFGRWATLIPLSCLAAILVVVAYNMSEWRSFRSLLRSPRSDVVVLVTTFLLTVIFDLTVAIEVGVVLAVFLFMRRMATVTNVGVVTRELSDRPETDDPNAIDKRVVPAGVEVYEINGPFFFGAAYKFKEAMTVVESQPRVRIIRMRDVPAIDSTGLHVLEEVYEDCHKQNVALIISEIHAQPLAALGHSGLLEHIGEENVIGTIDGSLARARELIGAES
jgi:SulP family sulfate permease